MPVVSVGDMSQQFISMRNGGTIKTELARLSESLSSGLVNDVTQALDGDTTRLSGINYSLEQLDGYAQAAEETSQTLANIQNVLGQFDTLRGDSSAQLLLINGESTINQIDNAARDAARNFSVMITTLNTQVADRALLGGADVTGAPLETPDVMLTDLQAAIGGATDFATIDAAITTWFDDPAGGFATTAYLGDTGAPVEKRISDTRTIPIEARADDPAIRETLKSAAYAALADGLPGLDRDTKVTMLERAGTGLYTAAADLVSVQSRIGTAESEVEQSQTDTNAQLSALQIARNDIVLADPFETASQLQSVQIQLETHYSVTARLSQLSLLRYI
ncbi:flagellin [Cognatiyoonia sp. IB215446]|uniref:flagellin n=1 Tax=Cognatiyoonia sp. IB215446 TaxID=3097355 RepID=UPI002A1457F3|nr:flagellin [Cognatiyoonia sp. IB215446]MDX8350356.1 flagellin [Cognatiyoonia sp. IB215446]